MHNTCKLLWLIFISIKFTEQYNRVVSNIDPIENYCSSFNSCRECKKASSQCDWCHETGCTHLPNFNCPQKIFLDRTYKKSNLGRFCTEIVSNGPVFIPANLRRFIRMNLKVDDLTIYKRNLICEIHIEEAILRVKGTLSEGVLYCDMTILRISQSVSLGYIRVLWGGAEPYSNMLLIIVYKCDYMASDCSDCQVLDRGFNCGWCEETSTCNLLEECPRQYGPWINKKSLCGRHKQHISYFNDKSVKPLLRYIP